VDLSFGTMVQLSCVSLVIPLVEIASMEHQLVVFIANQGFL